MASKSFRINPRMLQVNSGFNRRDFDWLVRHGMIKIGRDGLLNLMEAARTLDRLGRMASRLPGHQTPEKELRAAKRDAEITRSEAEEIYSAAEEKKALVDQMMRTAERHENLATKYLETSRDLARRLLREKSEDDSPDQQSAKWKH